MSDRFHLCWILLLLFCWSNETAPGQEAVFTFTGKEPGLHRVLDSIRVVNLSSDADTVLYWPDTVLWLEHVGISEETGLAGSFALTEPFPNPSPGNAEFRVSVPAGGEVELSMTDQMGRSLYRERMFLPAGTHRFLLEPGNERMVLLRVCLQNLCLTLKALNCSKSQGTACVSLIESSATPEVQEPFKVSAGSLFTFTFGDILYCQGYSEGDSAAFADNPHQSKDYTFLFHQGYPCHSKPYILCDGRIYNTVHIGNQCWMRDNLNRGTMIPGTGDAHNNGVIEKYCYDDDPAYCEVYGGLYQWNEMMQYSQTPSTKGICPDGFHLPSHQEWCNMELALDSTVDCTTFDWTGSDIGCKMKVPDTVFFKPPNTCAINTSGFTGLPAGFRHTTGDFYHLRTHAKFWSSDYYANTWAVSRYLNYVSMWIFQDVQEMDYGYSVRCMKVE